MRRRAADEAAAARAQLTAQPRGKRPAALCRSAAGRRRQLCSAPRGSALFRRFSVAYDRGAGVEARSARWRQRPKARQALLAAAQRTAQPTTGLERAPPHADARHASQAAADQAQKGVFSVAAAPRAMRPPPLAEGARRSAQIRGPARQRSAQTHAAISLPARALNAVPRSRRAAPLQRGEGTSLRLGAHVRDSCARILHGKQHRLAQTAP